MLASQKPNKESIASSADRHNRRIDSLIVEFEHTSLTVKEANRLRSLKQQLTAYNQLEGRLTSSLLNQTSAQQALFVDSSSTAFDQVAQRLDELAALQLIVGEELLGESRGETNYIYVLTALQIGLVLMIGSSLFWHRFNN